jgi:Ca2+-binding RTX toxin-like protein
MAVITPTIRGTVGDDILNGTDAAERIIGDGGNDTIHGAGGNDTVDAGDGADVIAGDAGDDTLRGGGGVDLFKFQAGDGKDTISDHADGETVEIRGYASAQSITQVGTSVVVVLSSGDQITFQNETVAAVEAALVFVDAPPVGQIIYGTSGNDTLDGTAGDDSIYGLAGADLLSGGEGNDYLAGFGDSYSGLSDDFIGDTLLGGAGDDSIELRYGDSVDGGTGTDILYVSFFGMASGVSVDFRGLADGGTISVGGGTIVGIEQVGHIFLTEFDDVVMAGPVPGSVGIMIEGVGGNDDITGSSGVDLINGGDGNDIIRGGIGYQPGTSSPVDSLSGGAGDDTIYIGADGASADGGSGNDVVHGGDATDTIYGYQGDDTLDGGGGGDFIDGGDGVDIISGGLGNDYLTGGWGIDLFKYAAGGGHDVIWDLGGGESVEVEGYEYVESIVEFAGPIPQVLVTFGGGDRITFLYTTAAIVQSALNIGFAPPPAPTEDDDSLLGTPEGDVISGLGGHDTIKGLAGNDTLNGDAGNDLLEGGAGADTIDGGAGNDTIRSAEGFPAGPHDTGTDHDTAFGGEGDDSIHVGYGDDADGGAGSDWLSVHFAGSQTGVTFGFSSASPDPISIGGGTLQNFEKIYLLHGSDFADNLTIVGQVSTVEGQGGNDFITVTDNGASIGGGSGNDVITVFGTGGYLSGGLGDDLFIISGVQAIVEGDGGNDTVDYRNAAAAMTINLGTIEQATTEWLIGISNVNGSAFFDFLTGNSQANRLFGAAGDDTLAGAEGDDRLEGGEGVDVFNFAAGDGQDTIVDLAAGEKVNVSGYASAQSITQVGADVIVVLSASDRITFLGTDVATVKAALPFGVSSTPTAGDDTLTGSDAANSINGLGGNDTIYGLAGNDTLDGGAGNDSLDGGAGNDTLRGGSGNDTMSVDSALDRIVEQAGGGTMDIVYASVSYVLAGRVEVEYLIGSGTGSINLTGNELAQSIGGNASNNVLVGLAGNDQLYGNEGNDILKGGLGADVLWGGFGTDLFAYAEKGRNIGNDQVMDFERGIDKIDLRALAITGANVTTALSGGNTVLSIDADRNGRVDYTVTLVGVAQVDSSDLLFA